MKISDFKKILTEPNDIEEEIPDQNDNITKSKDKNNSFVHIKNQNKIEFILMEKDKEIMNLTYMNKNLNEKIETLLNEIKNKDLEISSLKIDNNSLNNDKKLFDQEIEKYQKNIIELNKTIQNKNNEIEEIISKNNISSKKFDDIILTQKNEYNQLLKDFNIIQKDLNSLNAKLIMKDKIINKLENDIYKSKEKNNRLILLNKEIKEKNDIINNLQTKIGFINKELRISKSCNEEKIQNFDKIDKNEKNDIFSFFVEKIQNLVVFLENDKNFEKSENFNLNNKLIEIKEGFVLNDLLEQNILILKHKIFNRYNNLIKQNNQYKKIYKKQENKIKQNEQIIKQINQSLENKNNEIKHLNNKINEINKNASGLITQNKFNDFYRNFISKINKNILKEYYNNKNLNDFNDLNRNNNNDEKIINILDIIYFMNKKINHLNNFVKEYELYKIKVNKIINQNLNRSNGQNNEIKELKNNIKDLGELLEQSNIYLKQSREENDLLKTRNLNLEKTINMISKNNTMTISQNNKENLLNNNINMLVFKINSLKKFYTNTLMYYIFLMNDISNLVILELI